MIPAFAAAADSATLFDGRGKKTSSLEARGRAPDPEPVWQAQTGEVRVHTDKKVEGSLARSRNMQD